MKEEFIELLRSTKREGIENLLNFLEKSDFCSIFLFYYSNCPAALFA